MRKTVFGCLGAAAVAFALQLTPANVQAGFFNRCDPCEPVACNPCDAVVCDPCDPRGNGCFDGCNDGCGPVRNGGWFLNGHMEAGFFANAHGRTSLYGGTNPAGSFNGGAMQGQILRGNTLTDHQGFRGMSGNTEYLQNTRLTGAQVNQVYLSMGKAVDGRRGLDLGGTVDFTWGSDAYRVQTRGMETMRGAEGEAYYGRWGSGDYFSAFAQAYVEAEFDRWNVKAGKFYAPFGTGYKSTDNFFYTWSPNVLISPTVAGGAYATYKVNNRLSVIGGWVTPSELGESSKNNAFLGGFDFSPTKRFNLRYAFAAGEDTFRVAAGSRIDYYTHSFMATTQINKRLKYVFDWAYLETRPKTAGNVVGANYAYGLNNEVIYQLNRNWAFGTRFGMLRPGQMNGDAKVEWYNVSLGANWTPNKWLTVKPEIRYDWTDKGNVAGRQWFGSLPHGGDSYTYQFSGGLSAIVQF